MKILLDNIYLQYEKKHNKQKLLMAQCSNFGQMRFVTPKVTHA